MAVFDGSVKGGFLSGFSDTREDFFDSKAGDTAFDGKGAGFYLQYGAVLIDINAKSTGRIWVGVETEASVWSVTTSITTL